MEKKSKAKNGFLVDRDGFFVHASFIFLGIAVVLRVLGTVGYWGDTFKLATLVALPVASCLLFAVLVLLLGKHALWTTIIPVLGGAAFYILNATVVQSHVRMLLGIVFALAVAIVYAATFTGVLRSKWVLVGLFVLALAYQIGFIDLPAFRNTTEPISFASGITDLSSIGMLLGLLSFSLAVKKRKLEFEDADLPKMKAPKVLAPEREVAKEEPKEQDQDSPAAESTEQNEEK